MRKKRNRGNKPHIGIKIQNSVDGLWRKATFLFQYVLTPSTQIAHPQFRPKKAAKKPLAQPKRNANSRSPRSYVLEELCLTVLGLLKCLARAKPLVPGHNSRSSSKDMEDRQTIDESRMRKTWSILRERNQELWDFMGNNLKLSYDVFNTSIGLFAKCSGCNSRPHVTYAGKGLTCLYPKEVS